MYKLFYKLIQKLLNFQVYLHKKRLDGLYKKITKNSSSKLLHEDIELVLGTQTEALKTRLDEEIKKILKENNNNPDKLLDYIKESGTDVFKVKNANYFLRFIGEEEGFIPPLKGINAFFLNLFINFVLYKKILFSFKSNEMFVLRPLPVDIYYMIHQFHLWYGFKNGLVGYELKNRKKYKKILSTMDDSDIEKLSVDDILEIKEVIARDIESIDFVVNLAKESEASTKLLNKLKDGESVNL